jgi:chromosome segregation ATPase
MTKEEELDKINLEIKKAQDKLGDIDNAINRESLVIESKTKESSEIVARTKLLQDELTVLEENIAEQRQSLKIFKEDSKNKKDKLNEEISNIETELSTIGSALTSDITALEASKKGLIDQIDTLSISLKKESEKKEKTLTDLDRQIESKKSAISNLESEFKTKSDNYMAQIVTLNEKYDAKTIQIGELEAKISNLEKNIDSKEKELYKISTEILDSGEKKSDLEANIKELSSINESLLKEMKSLESEKAQYVADKFALQRNKDDMDKREEFIKNKYQEAGVRYN